jgi:hypothetical protein
MQAMIVAGLLAAPELLLDGDPHATDIVDLEFAHEPSHGEDTASPQPCGVI